ncbi:MAG: ATP-binding cassette domain-containing protein, partial [Pseudomonadota bacterium]
LQNLSFCINEGCLAGLVGPSGCGKTTIINLVLRLYDLSGGKILIDGGVLEPVPVQTALKYKPDIIIAIDINNLPNKNKPKNMLELSYKALWLAYYQLSRSQAALADIDIHPDLTGHGTFEDNNKEELYRLGREAALKELPKIKDKLIPVL